MAWRYPGSTCRIMGRVRKQRFYTFFFGATAEAQECARGPCRHRATRLCVEATHTLAEASGGSVVFEGRPWNSNTVDLIRLARAHCLLVLHSTFADSVAKMAAEVRACVSSASDMKLAGTRLNLAGKSPLDSLYGCWARCRTCSCRKARMKDQGAYASTIDVTERPAEWLVSKPRKFSEGCTCAGICGSPGHSSSVKAGQPVWSELHCARGRRFLGGWLPVRAAGACGAPDIASSIKLLIVPRGVMCTCMSQGQKGRQSGWSAHCREGRTGIIAQAMAVHG